LHIAAQLKSGPEIFSEEIQKSAEICRIRISNGEFHGQMT